MSVIVDVRVPASGFELGRALRVQFGERVELETLVPLGERAIPLLWVYHVDREAFVASATAHPSVRELREMDAFDDRSLFALEWAVETDGVLRAIVSNGGQLLEATGSHEEWRLELRFPDHEAVSAFRAACDGANVPLTVRRVVHPDGDDERDYGLTALQRETLLLAVESGYYDVPRRCTTVELGEKLGVSDQAVTERLRRGIATLVTNVFVASDGD